MSFRLIGDRAIMRLTYPFIQEQMPIELNRIRIAPEEKDPYGRTLTVGYLPEISYYERAKVNNVPAMPSLEWYPYDEGYDETLKCFGESAKKQATFLARMRCRAHNAVDAEFVIDCLCSAFEQIVVNNPDNWSINSVNVNTIQWGGWVVNDVKKGVLYQSSTELLAGALVQVRMFFRQEK